jgi:DNA-binding transcriptional LysR family regulator
MHIDRLHLMNVFVAVAEEAGFAGAARRLNMSPPAVTRAIAALEQHLGIKLLNRTTRFVRATEAGQRYLEDAKRVIAAADEADESAAGLNAEPRGHILVTAPVLFGRLYIMPGIIEYMNRYTGMEVSALFVDRVVNMLEEGVDVAIRIGELPDSSYRAVRVGSVKRLMIASPSYLAQHGTPQSIEELAQHQIVLARGLNPSPELKFSNNNQPVVVKVKPKLLVNDNDSAIAAVVAGFGMTRLLSYQVAPQLTNGTLQAVLTHFEPQPVPVHIVHNESRYTSVKIRAFIDLMAQRLKADQALNPQSN